MKTLSPIICLFLPSCPPAVRFAVRPIVIDALNRCVFLSKLQSMHAIRGVHIVSKCFKRLPKAFYSATTIALEICAIWLITALQNTSVRFVKLVVLGPSMGRICFACDLFLQATARMGVSLSKAISPHNYFVTAVTNAQPFVPSASILARLFNNNKARKSQPQQVSFHIHKVYHA